MRSADRTPHLLLVNPRFGAVDGLVILPLDLASVAAYALSQGVRVDVIDLAFDADDDIVVRDLECWDGQHDLPSLVVITCTTLSYRNAVQCATRIKARFPFLTLALMGEHVTFRPIETLERNPAVDLVLTYEAELTVVDLLRESDVSAVGGVFYRRAETGEIASTPTRPPIKPLDLLPVPARRLFPLSAYKRRDYETTLVTSRGCPYSCSFCHRTRVGRRPRSWSIEHICSEIEDVIGLGFKSIFFQDDLFCYSKSRVRAICTEILRRGIVVEWNCNVRVDSMAPDRLADQELIRLMREAGCYRVFMGVETLSHEVLEDNLKTLHVDNPVPRVRQWQEAGIQVHASFVVGLPGDSEEGVLTTAQFAGRHLQPDIATFNRLFPHPGTVLGDAPETCGVTLPDPLWYESDGWQQTAVAGSIGLGPRQVQDLQNRATLAFLESV